MLPHVQDAPKRVGPYHNSMLHYIRVTTACLTAAIFVCAVSAQTNVFVGAPKQGVVLEFSSFDDLNFTETTFTSIAQPGTMIFDSNGNLFISNGAEKTIKKITPSGVKTTFASNIKVEGMAFDALGNLFVSPKSKDTDASEGEILEFAPDGTSRVFASSLTKPLGLAVDFLGNVYVADPVHDAILKISPDGRRTTFATGFSRPYRLAFVPAGDLVGYLYVTDTAANNISAVSPSGVVTDIEDFGPVSTSGGTINDLAFDSLGNLFVTFADTVIEFPGGVDVDETTVASVPYGAGAIAISPPLATNLSTRVSVQGSVAAGQHSTLAPGSGAAIAGFIISGSGPRKVLLRGIGPSLSKFQIANALQDPTLDLADSNGNLIAGNDDWQSATNADQIPIASQPADSHEPAILTTLQPGRFTAILRGKNQSGIGLVEIDDLTTDTSSRLTNVSTRGFVGAGENVMIAGFMLTGGSGPREVLVRALGPSLGQPPINLAGSLQDPTLMLVDANGSVVASNDDWKASQEAEIQATGLAPPNEREAAILANLPAGNFTAIVAGKNGNTGLALVDVFNSF